MNDQLPQMIAALLIVVPAFGFILYALVRCYKEACK